MLFALTQKQVNEFRQVCNASGIRFGSEKAEKQACENFLSLLFEVQRYAEQNPLGRQSNGVLVTDTKNLK